MLLLIMTDALLSFCPPNDKHLNYVYVNTADDIPLLSKMFWLELPG